MKKSAKFLGVFLVIILLFLFYFFYNNQLKEYSNNFFYMDTYINVKIFAKNEKTSNAIFDKIDNFYLKYHKLTNAYDENSQVYYINNNNDPAEELTIDEELYKMIDLSLEWNKKSNGKFNINIGKIIKIWNEYRDKHDGIPSLEELNNAYNNINDIVLLGNNKIKNTHPSIDLGGISKGYVSQMVADMLEENNIKNYIISAGGNVVVGQPYKKDYFKIGIESPEEENKIYKVIKANNVSVVTSGGYKRFYEYNGVKYHHIIDPDTLYPSSHVQSVTVIALDSGLADILSTTLFLLPIDDGLKLVNSLDDVEAIYYVNEDNIIKSEGFNKYE